MKKAQMLPAVFFLPVLIVCLAGCSANFLDPTQIGRFRPVPAVNIILDSLGVAEETPSAWEGAEEPKPVDVIAYETDYVFNPGDTARVAIFELEQEGGMATSDYVVTETGKISIPVVGVVQAAGLTESQLEEEIKQILSPTILKEPSVSVILLNSQQRTFSILGNGVAAPSRYNLPRYDFRLADAIAAAGGVAQFNVSDIYVSRNVTGKEVIKETTEPKVTEPAEQMIEPEKEMLEIISPRAQHQPSEKGLVITSAEMITDKELTETNIKGTINKPINEEEAGRVEWIFQNGKWVPVQIGISRPPVEPAAKDKLREPVSPLEEKAPSDFGWDQIESGGAQRRVIKIPVDKFLGGDPRYNIIIRPGDNIHVPLDIVGAFLVEGNTNYQGLIDTTGKPMTLKMAIAAAGGLGPLAWPKHCEVIRRIGRNKEEIVMVDLDKIARGEQPDFYIKPNDLINVGTHPTARWQAVLRNAFRATYGFGFVYDRNFADRDYGTGRPFNWF